MDQASFEMDSSLSVRTSPKGFEPGPEKHLIVAHTIQTIKDVLFYLVAHFYIKHCSCGETGRSLQTAPVLEGNCLN